MNEILPVTFGVIAGLVMGSVTVRRPLAVWIGLSVVLGVAATFLTGEWQASWAFVLVDVPLVALAAVAAHLGARRAGERWRSVSRSAGDA